MRHEKCLIHDENLVFIYTKRSSRVANKKLDVGKRCETCVVGILNSMTALIPEELQPKYPYQKEWLGKKIRKSCPCGNLQSKDPRPAITCYDGACK